MKPIQPHIYAALRIGCGLVALLVAFNMRGQLDFLFSDQGFYRPELARAIEGSPLRFSLLYWLASPNAVLVLYVLRLGATIAFVVGWHTRVSGFLTWLLFLSFYNRNVINIYGPEQVLVSLLLILQFTPCGAVWSLDGRKASSPPPAQPIALYLVRYQVCFIYFMSGLNKALGANWLRGDAVLYALMNPDVRHFDLDWLWVQPWAQSVMHLFDWTVVAWELSFFALVCWKPTRYLALLIGICVHGGQWIFIETGYFPPLMFTLYLAFLEPDAFARGATQLLRRSKLPPV